MLTQKMLYTFFNENAQLAIFTLGTIGIFLMSIKSRWGVAVGLLAQPFWLASTFHDAKWGMFANTIGYTISLSIGIIVWFFPKKQFLVMIEVDGVNNFGRVEGKSFEEVVGKIKIYLGERGNVMVTPIDQYPELSAKQFSENLEYLRKRLTTPGLR